MNLTQERKEIELDTLLDVIVLEKRNVTWFFNSTNLVFFTILVIEYWIPFLNNSYLEVIVS